MGVDKHKVVCYTGCEVGCFMLEYSTLCKWCGEREAVTFVSWILKVTILGFVMSALFIKMSRWLRL
jgi:hypothetical protein